jgi:hypothetical protein
MQNFSKKNLNYKNLQKLQKMFTPGFLNNLKRFSSLQCTLMQIRKFLLHSRNERVLIFSLKL